MAERLERRGIAEPFPIQAAALPDALAGRDVCGKAPTGSGKTIAFGIPLVLGIEKAKPRKPRGLVLVPTRELASQVCSELRSLAGGKPSVTAIYGGVGFGPQTRALREGVDIVVACPGRLADLVQQREISLSEVSFVVLDEADRMADMGFMPEVKRLLDQVRPDRQTLLFSATLDGAVDELVKRYQHEPARHEHTPEDDGPPSRHIFWNVDRSNRVHVTAQVITAEWPAIVFCRTKHGADRVARQLNKSGVTAVAMHGDRSQGQRKRALGDFSNGRAQALVATDVAARGIHVDDVASVVHFDPPADEKDYVHRSGRTGRAGASGVVVSLVADEQIGDVRKMQRRLGMDEGYENVDLDALDDDRYLVRPAATEGASSSNGSSSSKGRSGRNGSSNGNSSRSRTGSSSGGQGRGRSGRRPEGRSSESRTSESRPPRRSESRPESRESDGRPSADGPRPSGSGKPRNGGWSRNKPTTGAKPKARTGGTQAAGKPSRRPSKPKTQSRNPQSRSSSARSRRPAGRS
jgi:superfamily II DNA/RNA helicase